MPSNKRLLIFVDWFIPGFKAGGQIQSCANLAEALHPFFEVFVLTTDRDLGETAPYPSIKPGEWNTLPNGVKVFYLTPQQLNRATFGRLTREVAPHTIYLNSMFSWHFTMVPLLLYYRAHSQVKIVLAPRGMLHPGALQYSRLKKKVFLTVFKAAGLHTRILFHATDAREAGDMRTVFGNAPRISMIQDFNTSSQPAFQPVQKQKGQLRCVFVSRIAAKKNLLYLLNLLADISMPVQLTIAGPVEEEAYWQECQSRISTLPPHIRVEHLGAVPHHRLRKVYQGSHLFVLPTHGENFGHVIFESLLNGRPVLISDQTPWQDLHLHKAGWAVPLSNRDMYLAALAEAADWDQAAFDERARAAWDYASRYIAGADLVAQYTRLFS